MMAWRFLPADNLMIPGAFTSRAVTVAVSSRTTESLTRAPPPLIKRRDSLLLGVRPASRSISVSGTPVSSFAAETVTTGQVLVATF